MYLVELCAKFTLWSLGWELLNQDLHNKIVTNDRVIAVFSHTSYLDFYILILYLLAHPQLLSHVRVLIKPQPFIYAGPLLRWLGAIPSTSITEHGQGSVQRIADILRQNSRFFLLISPKGTILKREWRSGYYHIAKNLKVPIIVAGLDYYRKTGYISNPIDSAHSEEVVKECLYQHLTQIVPLYPAQEVVECIEHDANQRSLANWPKFFTVWGLIYGTILYKLLY